MPEETDDGPESNGGSRADDYGFTDQDDGRVTPGHLGTGIVASGTSDAEALVDRTDALDDEHDAQPIGDPEPFLAALDLPDPGSRGEE